MAFPVDGASSSSSSSSSCPSDFTPQENYHVFLSFRGEDTRKGFTSHLYASLNQKGIITFKDDNELERGEVISSELIKAIEGSMFAIIILSPKYAFSTWCLDELQKIVECKKILGQVIVPIFYGVEPSDVRHQRGTFAEAFIKHEEKFRGDKEKMQRWRDALMEVANISGWDFKEKDEAELIESIVEELYRKLLPKLPYFKDGLVGIDSRVEEVNSLLGMGLHDVRFIGIWGMGGIGKTTIAREVYERIQGAFQVSCFLPDIREVSETKGLVNIQGQLLSQLKRSSIDVFELYDGRKKIRNLLHKKKALIVLDDVTELSQLENLAGKEDWFGPGSRVIVTTRDKHLLIKHKVLQEEYNVGVLNHDEALQLFCQKAFKRDEPKEGYLDLSKDVVKHAGGLPLALEVLGSFLCGRTVNTWHSALEQIKNMPDPKILDKLKISYDGLRPMEKNMFLDIACFFKGMEKHEVIEILENCGDFPEIGIEILIEKSLLTLRYDKLWMHDLLQEMGKNIVFQESPSNPGRRSRLWKQVDINNVLVKNKGTEAIQGMVLDLPQGYEAISGIALDLPQGYEACLHPDAFSRTSQLKLLKLCNTRIPPHGLNSLPSALKVLDWIQCPLKSLPHNIELDELVDLKLCHSKLEKLWNGTKFLGSLKFIDLSFSKNLTQSPDISGVPNLERLVLEGCESLFKVHPSLGLHRKLVLVNFKDCKNLIYLPNKMEMSSMEHLILSGCSKVKWLPEFGGSMEHLSTLSLDGTSITELPLSLGCLIGLADLNLKDCKSLVGLPSTIQNLKSLMILNISGCSKISRLPENIKEIKCLKELNVSETAIEEVPSCIFHLNLEVLSFEGCQGLVSMSWNWLQLFGCIFGSPPAPKGLRLPHSFSTLSSLRKLNLSYCNLSEGSIPSDIECLSSLMELDLSGNNFISLPSSISELSMLLFLHLNCCKRLQLLPELPLQIEVLDACNCTSLEILKFNSKQCSLVPWSKKKIFKEENNDAGNWTSLESVTFTSSCIIEMGSEGLMFKENNNDAMNPVMVQSLAQVYQCPEQKFKMLIPGDKIPSWFDTQNSCSLAIVQLELPRNGPQTEWVGIALCCAVLNPGYPPNLYCRDFHGINCHMGDGTRSVICSGSDIPYIEPSQPHFYILYLSATEFRGKIYKNHDRSKIEIRFENATGAEGLEIMGCGGRLVYEQDFEDWNKTIWCKNSVILPNGKFESANDMML